MDLGRNRQRLMKFFLRKGNQVFHNQVLDGKSLQMAEQSTL
ncbi:hypothetical protein LEP1GSC048_1074 [Leptospira santarosai serovar Shermani str. 1342KT]|nr:hypothetical protein LEP1GSC048_1074 [Leptospira santarosai serovar Shermani str. 1342KT]